MIEKNHLSIYSDQVLLDNGRYQRLVGRLIYIAHTRSNNAYVASVMGQFMSSPSVDNTVDVMRTLAYLKSTPGKGILYRRHGHLKFEGFTNAD